MAFIADVGGSFNKYFDYAPDSTAAPYWKNIKGMKFRERIFELDANTYSKDPDVSYLYIFLESADISIKLH